MRASATSRPTPTPASRPTPTTSTGTADPVAATSPVRRSLDIPVADHPSIQFWIDYFSGPGATRFARWLELTGTYEPLLRPLLHEAGVPEDLVYLAMIESGLSPRAYSRARAAGLWQFIETTGAHYGLRQSFWVDERRDPVKSTRAAAAHLLELHRLFGDWFLAWAAYNAGAGKIQGAIKRYGSRDYFELCRHPYLRRETKDYVPKIIAAATIARHPEQFGFSAVKPLPPWSAEQIALEDATDLGLVASGCGIPVEQLAELNPELSRWASPPVAVGGTPYLLRVPAGLGPICRRALDAVPAGQRLTFRHHRVRPGEVPGKIAARYGIGLHTMMQMNKISDPRRMRAGRDLIIPIPSRVPEQLFRRDPVRQRPGDDGDPGYEAPRPARKSGTD